MITQEKPPLDDALLMHFGVAGMKWGHRKAANSVDIHAARKRVKAANAAYKTKLKAAKGTKDKGKRAAALHKLEKTNADMLKNPDRIVSARMTRAQKIVTTVLFPPGGIAAIAATSARSRHIEQRQDKGKKK